MRRKGIRSLAGVAVCIAAALAVGGCGGGSEEDGASAPGVTETTVKIGSHQPLTGPAAPGYSAIAGAARAMFERINAEGGVHGRSIELIAEDDAYNPTKTVEIVRRLVLQDKVFALWGGLGTATHTKVVDFLTAQRVPDLFVISGCACWDDAAAHPYTFAWQVSYVIEGKLLGNYIKEHFPGQKVGVFYQDDDFGQGGLEGLKGQLGDRIVAAEPYQPGDTNVAPQITAIQRAGAEVLVDFTIPAYTALSALTAFKLGYEPQLVVSDVSVDPATVGGLLKEFSRGRADTELIEGAISLLYLPPPTDTSNPWIRLFQDVHEESGADDPLDVNLVYAMASAYTFAQALKEAGEEPTREALVEAVEQGGFRGPGLVPFRYSDDLHGGFGGGQIAVVENGELVLKGKPLVTDPGDGPIETYEGGQPDPEEVDPAGS